MTHHDMVSVIIAKRDGGELSDSQIDWVVAEYAAGRIGDEQMAALAMAIVLRGMERREIARWTAAMIASGSTLDLSGIARDGRRLATVDKHSTGGVGDKISLPLAPLVASYGVAVPQLSGRGLGHTGGTLDKLEAIPGWSPDLSVEQLRGQLAEVGAAICAATGEFVPADKRLYALRDVTGTVQSRALIASSIMSKKIASGASALVLDVKVGAGAFMKDEAQARALAETMVELGTDSGMATVALLTAMDAPLGYTAGNAVEVAEALEVLAGGGPADVAELTVALAREMLGLAGVTDAEDPADRLARGGAMDTWRAMIAAQGGDPEAALPQARESQTIVAEADGVLAGLDAMAVGIAAWRLGAGRERPGDPVQAGAGVRWHAKPGDRVTSGRPLFTMYTDTPERFAAGAEALAGAATIADAAPQPKGVVLGRVAR